MSTKTLPSNINYGDVLSYIQGSNNVNDFQLVSELGQIVREYQSKGKHVDKKFIKKIYSVICNNYRCCCTKIYGNSDDSSSVYDEDFDEILLEYRSFNWMYPNKEGELLPEEDVLMEEYYQAIDTVVHEFTHKMQFEFLSSFSDGVIDIDLNEALKIFAAIYLFEDSLMCDYDRNDEKYNSILNYYFDTHDSWLRERIANNRGNYIAMAVMRKIYGEEKSFNYFLEFINDLLYEYDEAEKFPLKTFGINIDNQSSENSWGSKLGSYQSCVPQINIVDGYLFERMCLGLPISDVEYNNVLGLINPVDYPKTLNSLIKKRKLI